MDADSPVSRIERTFWTVWGYITDAVNRFFRPEPTESASNDPNSIQASSDHGQQPRSAHADLSIDKEEDEEQPLATVSLLNSSQPNVSWEVCTSEIDLGPEEDIIETKTQLRRSDEGKESEDGEGIIEEPTTQTGSDNADLGVSKEENKEAKLHGHGQDAVQQTDEEQLNRESLHLTDTALDEHMEKPDDQQILVGVQDEDDETHHDGDFQDSYISYKLEIDEIGVNLCTVRDLQPLEQVDLHMEEASLQRDDADTVWVHEETEQAETQPLDYKQLSDDDVKEDPSEPCSDTELQMNGNKRGIVSDNELTIVGQEQTVAERSEGSVNGETEEEHTEEEEDRRGDERKRCIDSTEQETVTEVAEMIKDEVPKQEEDNRGVAEDSKEDEEHSAYDVKAGKDREQENVEVISERNDVTTEAVSASTARSPSVTVKLKGQTGQEVGKATIPLGRLEGQGVVSLQLNSTTYKETQEGVPEYNNEPEPGGNTTQRFLEAADYEEFQTTQLQEEVECKESESCQNSSNSREAECLLDREHIEEEQQQEPKGEDVLRDVLVEENAETLIGTDAEEERPLRAMQGPGSLLEELGQLLDSSTKTGIEDLEKELEKHFLSKDETDEKTTDPQEQLLVEFETDEPTDEGSGEADATGDEPTQSLAAGDCTGKLLKAEELSFPHKPVDTSCETYTLLDDVTNSGFLKKSAEAKLLEDNLVEKQDAEIDVEVVDGVKEEDETQSEIFKLQEVEIAVKEEQNAIKTESDLTKGPTMESISDEVLDISTTEMLPNTDFTEIKAKDTEDMLQHVIESEGGYTPDSISARQDVIDEEILDLWIQTALSEDADDSKQQEEPGPGQEMETRGDASNERRDEMLYVEPEDEEKEQEVVVNFFNDPNVSSSTAQSGFLDHSADEQDTRSNETQPPELSQTFQDTSEFQINQPGCQDLVDTGLPDMNKEQLNPQVEFHPDSVVTDLSQGSQKLPEETDECQVKSAVEGGVQQQAEAEASESTSQIEAEECDAHLLKQMNVCFEAELTKDDDEPLETVSNSPDDIEDTDSGRSSETETTDNVRSQSDAQVEQKLAQPEPEESEEMVKSLPENLQFDQVDGRILDITLQKSRIAVKNRHVRPPKDPRSLLHKPSVDPTPATHLPLKLPVGVPLGGVGIGIKLPGLGGGLPVLKKTPKAVRDANNPEASTQESGTEPDDKDDTPEKANSQPKPKWMPPGHPGFGNPLMSELKTKLRKTTK